MGACAKRRRGLAASALAAVLLQAGMEASAAGETSRLSDEPISYRGDNELPLPTPPIFELGDVFLRPGNIKPGFELPTGAVWQPRFWVFGTIRSSLATFDNGGSASRPIKQQSEWFNRADIFGNLQLTGSERLLIGFQPMNVQRRFTGYRIKPDRVANGFQNEFNSNVRTLFFEGDIGQIFPRLDRNDTHQYDIGFAVGRQEMSFQGGMLLNDTLDALGVTKNNMRIEGWDWLNNLRVTGLAALNDVNDPNANVYGLFTSLDTVFGNRIASTIDIDVTYVNGYKDRPGDLWSGGISATQRIGRFNNTLRILGSYAPGARTAFSNNGTLVFNELSWDPYGTHNLAYVNMFWGNDQFRSAARGPLAGGPLGRVGLLFAARGVGTYPAPLNNVADDAIGGAVGYQMFFDDNRRQITVEAGGRHEFNSNRFDSAAIGVRMQQALGRRYILDVEAYGVARKNADNGGGLRVELLVKL